MLERPELDHEGAPAQSHTVSTSTLEDTNMQEQRDNSLATPEDAHGHSAPPTDGLSLPQNLAGFAAPVKDEEDPTDALARGVQEAAQQKAPAVAPAPVAQRAYADDVEAVVVRRDDKGKEDDVPEGRTIASVMRKPVARGTGTPEKFMPRPHFGEASSPAGKVRRPAADEPVAAQNENIASELNKVVSVPYRNKTEGKIKNPPPQKYFEIFEHEYEKDEKGKRTNKINRENKAGLVAGRKLLRNLEKLGIRNLILVEKDDAAKIAGDDATRVIVLSGNTQRSTYLRVFETDGAIKFTKEFRYLTIEERFTHKSDIDRNRVDNEGRHLMHYAMLSSSLPMIRLVSKVCETLAEQQFSENFTINKADKFGYTPVHYACMTGTFHELQINPKPEPKKRKWIVYDSIEKKDKETLRNIVLPEVTGLTIADPNVIIDFMNSKHAKYDSRSIYGETPLQCAILSNSVNLIPLLVACSTAAKTVDINDIEYGIQGMKITSKMSIVHYAAMHPEVTAETLRIIIEKCYEEIKEKNVAPVYGCVNLRDENGNTPLHYAAATGNLRAMIVLMSYGADANVLNNDGKTPLQIASRLVLKSNGNNTFTLKFSTDVPGVQNVLSRFGGDVAYQRKLTQETIDEFKDFVTTEILQGRLFTKVAQKLDDIFPLWYDIRLATEDQRDPKNVKLGKIYITPDGKYLVRKDHEVIEAEIPSHFFNLNSTEGDLQEKPNLEQIIRDPNFRNLLLAITGDRGHTIVEHPKTLVTQAQCFVDAALWLLIMNGHAKPELDSRAPLRAKKIVECENELLIVTNPNFTQSFDRSKSRAYWSLLNKDSKEPSPEVLIIEPDVPNVRALNSAHMLLNNYYSRGWKNQYFNRFAAWFVHPGRGHQEAIKNLERKLNDLPDDKEGQLKASSDTLHAITKAIYNNPYPHRRAYGSSALSRVGVVRQLIDRSTVNGHSKEVPELKPANDKVPAADDYDNFEVDDAVEHNDNNAKF